MSFKGFELKVNKLIFQIFVTIEGPYNLSKMVVLKSQIRLSSLPFFVTGCMYVYICDLRDV